MREACLRVTYSQDLRVLLEELVAEFWPEESSPFESRLLVVPHGGIKEFIQENLALHPRLQIAAGVQIVPLHQAVMEVIDRSDLKESIPKIPSLLELSLAIQDLLLKSDLILTEDPVFADYLQMTLSSPRKLQGLADQLAKLFSRYGLFGEKFLSSWLKKEGWQQDLWRRIFKKWSYPLAFFSELKELSFHGKIALFGFSFIPPVHLDFFASLKASCYLFSPCSLFWEDLVSNKEQVRLDRLAQRHHVSPSTRQQLQSYLSQHHPLLANWGKMGRQMIGGLQKFTLIEEERYEIPSSDSMLARIQRSILNLEKETFSQEDDSIQIHSSPSLLREVEVLRDGLESLIQLYRDRKEELLPEDILVVAPDLSLYIPSILAVFHSSAIPYTLETKSEIAEEVRGFLSLLSLSKQRYPLEELMILLQIRSFREKAGVDLEEVTRWEGWFR